MSVHTPGPWTVSASLVNHDELHILCDGEGGPVVAAVWPMGEDFNEEADEPGPRAANARLIAAAPELLDALRGAEEIYAEYIALRPDPHAAAFGHVTKAVCAMRAAIAKAEGGQ